MSGITYDGALPGLAQDAYGCSHMTTVGVKELGYTLFTFYQIIPCHCVLCVHSAARHSIRPVTSHFI